MKLSGFTTQFPVLWGSSGTSATVQYPLLSGSDVAAGRASVAAGFPAANFTPPEAGGVYPWGADWNGALKTLSVSAQNYESGLVPIYSADFSSSIGGYPLNAIVSDPTTAGVYWVSTTDSNTSAPGSANASWQSLFSGYLTTATAKTSFMALSGPAQTSSSPTTFNNGLSTTGTVSDWTSDTVPNAVTIASYFLGKSGNAQATSSPTTFSDGLYATHTVADWTTAEVPGANQISGRFLANAGAEQTSSSPTTFDNGLLSTYNVTDWTTNQVPNAVTIEANFLSKAGNDQTSSSPTTFSNGLWSTGTFYVPQMKAVGTDAGAYITLGSDMRCGSQTVYVNTIALDGTATRAISGATNVSDQWNFSDRPEVNGTDVALVSDFSSGTTSNSGTYITVGSVRTLSFRVDNTTNGQTIAFPIGFSGTPTVTVSEVGSTSYTYVDFNVGDPPSAGSFVFYCQTAGRSIFVTAQGPA